MARNSIKWTALLIFFCAGAFGACGGSDSSDGSTAGSGGGTGSDAGVDAIDASEGGEGGDAATAGDAGTGGTAGDGASAGAGGTDDAGGCAAPLVSCDGTCVDTSSDPLHCGSCNSACGWTERCCNGTCTDPVGDVAPPLVTENACGMLIYGRYANEGQNNADHILPDFSFAGYRGGGVALPIAEVKETVSPGSGDDRARIQAAIDAVSALPLDANGLRGAVLLEAGDYQVGDTLRIQASGVVLRGEGQGTNGTVLTATKTSQHDLIVIRGDGDGFGEVDGSRVAITDSYVPVGARILSLESTQGYAVGDSIVVVRTPNQFWIDDLEMAQWGWTPDAYEIEHERTVVAIDGDKILLDIPIVDTIEDSYGGGEVYRSSPSGRISECGVENLRLDSVYSSATDEAHGWKAIRFARVFNSWVRDVTAIHFGYSAVSIEGESKFNTVQDSATLDPISEITGGRRYSFNVSGTIGNLFLRCYSREARHDFVTGARVPGPNVWLDCLSENSHSDDGPHHRWAQGLLFDNVKSLELNVQNREESGTGHGWAGAQTLFWNSEADEIRCDAPLGAMNWAVGCVGTKSEGKWAPEAPFGWWESHGQPVGPRSLYLKQLEVRKGAAAVDAIALPAQRTGRIWTLLGDWAGAGPIADYGPDPTCNRGISSGNACCAASCGTCGGTGCSQLPGGAESCCVGAITSSGRLCSEVGPPCLMQ